jgi:hypothetical protein
VGVGSLMRLDLVVPGLDETGSGKVVPGLDETGSGIAANDADTVGVGSLVRLWCSHRELPLRAQGLTKILFLQLDLVVPGLDETGISETANDADTVGLESRVRLWCSHRELPLRAQGLTKILFQACSYFLPKIHNSL